MGKINNTRNYPVKTPEPDDKLVGSSAVTGETHNFLVKNLKASSRLVNVLDYGASVNNSASVNSVAFQNCADYCIENNKVMYVPYNEEKYLIDRPIAPSRTKGLSMLVAGVIKNTYPAFDRINLNGVVVWAGCLTHPYQSMIEGLNNGEYLHRLSNGVNAGDRELSVDVGLYNAVSSGEVVLVRSDLLSVDRTGEATGTAGTRRYGVYEYSILNKISNKYVNTSGDYILEFEHDFEETVYEPRLVSFPTDQYVDTFQSDPKLFVGPAQNLNIECTDTGGFETSGNQSFIQATCLYNFSLKDIRIINAAGGVLCNALNHGVIDGLYGECRGSSLEIAFSSNNVICKNIFPTVRGRGDKTNPNVSDGTNTMRNQGGGAINASGVMDYSYDAVWYANTARTAAIVYNKDNSNWDYFTSESAMWDAGTLPTTITSLTDSGWGSDIYVPVGTEGGITMTKALSENKSTVNIHEGARNITVVNTNVNTAADYDFIDQDINAVGQGLTFSNCRIYSNKFIAVQPSPNNTLEGDSISIGNVISGGDAPFRVNDITIEDVVTNGRPVNAIVAVNECPLFPDQKTTSMVLSGGVAGTFTKLTYNYFLSGDDLASGVIVRAADSTENPKDRYYAYFSSVAQGLLVFSIDGFAGKGKGWYLLPATSVTEPASAGGVLTGVNFASLANIYDNTNSFTIAGTGGFTNLNNFVIYLGEECYYVIFGAAGAFINDNGNGEKITFVPNIAYRTYQGIDISNISGRRAALRGVHVRGGVRNSYSRVKFDRFIEDNANPSNVPSTRYLFDVETDNPYYVSGNTFDDIKSNDSTLSSTTREPYRDQGYANKRINISDNRSRSWLELYRRYFRQTAGGTMRQIFDFTPSLGVALPSLSGAIPQNATTTFDTLNFTASSFRTGYSLEVRMSGEAVSGSQLSLRGGNPSSLSSIFTQTLNGSFSMSLNITMLDFLGASGDDGNVLVSMSLLDGSGESNFSDIVQIAVIGGTRQFAFVFVTDVGETVNIYSYEVMPKDNQYL